MLRGCKRTTRKEATQIVRKRKEGKAKGSAAAPGRCNTNQDSRAKSRQLKTLELKLNQIGFPVPDTDHRFMPCDHGQPLSMA